MRDLDMAMLTGFPLTVERVDRHIEQRWETNRDGELCEMPATDTLHIRCATSLKMVDDVSITRYCAQYGYRAIGQSRVTHYTDGFAMEYTLMREFRYDGEQ